MTGIGTELLKPDLPSQRRSRVQNRGKRVGRTAAFVKERSVSKMDRQLSCFQTTVGGRRSVTAYRCETK